VNQWVQKPGSFHILEIQWVAIYLPDLAAAETTDRFWISPEIFVAPYAISSGLQCRYAAMQRATKYGLWQLDTFTKVLLNMRRLKWGEQLESLSDIQLDEDDPEFPHVQARANLPRTEDGGIDFEKIDQGLNLNIIFKDKPQDLAKANEARGRMQQSMFHEDDRVSSPSGRDEDSDTRDGDKGDDGTLAGTGQVVASHLPDTTSSLDHRGRFNVFPKAKAAVSRSTSGDKPVPKGEQPPPPWAKARARSAPRDPSVWLKDSDPIVEV
jgi:hypothetical protein